MSALFRQVAEATALWVGTWQAFVLACGSIVLWFVTGPLFGWSDTWQLVINTSTTVVTFLLVVVIQYTQNRDSAALHVKLDELLRAVPQARNRLIDAQHMTDEELDDVYRDLLAARAAREGRP